MTEPENPQNTGGPQRRVPTWLKATLVVSLAANVLIIGLVAGAALRGPRADFRAGPAGDFGFVARAMPHEHQLALREGLRERRDDLREGRRLIDRAVDQLADALVAQPFDIGVIEQMMQQQREAIGRMSLAGHRALLDRIQSMTPDERAEFAEHLRRHR